MRQKVIYIAGHGHSGSTLLDLIIGSHSRVESVGEVTQKGLTRLMQRPQEELCTCGRPFSQCPYWQANLDHLRELGIISPKDVLIRSDELIKVVLRASDKSVYLESTKSIDRLQYFLSSPNLDLHIIHIVRDPRATVASFVAKGRRKYSSALRWGALGRQIKRLSGSRPLLNVQYESLVTFPEKEVRRVMDFIGEPFEPRQLDYASFTHHNIAGNRARNSRSSGIRPDTNYIGTLGFFRWYYLTALCWPDLLRNGYSITRWGMRRLLSKT